MLIPMLVSGSASLKQTKQSTNPRHHQDNQYHQVHCTPSRFYPPNHKDKKERGVCVCVSDVFFASGVRRTAS